jgi:hypothetical protein
MKRESIIWIGAAAATAAAAFIFGPGRIKKAFASKEHNDPVIDPVEAGVIEFTPRPDIESGGISSSGGNSSFESDDSGVSQELTRVVIPLDEPSEFYTTFNPGVKEVVFESPQLFVSTETGQIVPTIKTEILTKNVDGVQQQQTVYIDQFGNTFGSKQELLDAAVKISDAVNSELQQGNALSLIEALAAGKPVNTTNFITERPVEFPEAAIDSEFQRRAQALGATLTSDNPGASSAARIANFSRLAALGTDLSKVDIYGVQNPDFLGGIKTGQGPLTTAQKQLLDQVRLSIDPRNMTSSDFEEIRKNQAKAAAEKEALAKEVAALKASGLTLDQAKKILNQFGFAINGPVTYELFATLNDRFGEVQASSPTVSAAQQYDATKNLQQAVATAAGSSQTGSQAQSQLKTFLAQTGRTNLDNLAPAELFRLQKAGFNDINPLGPANQPAVLALKLLL